MNIRKNRGNHRKSSPTWEKRRPHRFEEAYRAKRYQDIITVGGKLNQSLIDSSTEIFDFIDIAEAKVE